jgi:hypothetical protein
VTASTVAYVTRLGHRAGHVARRFSRIRLVVLGVLVVGLAALLAWLTDCGKGLGVGQSSAPASDRDAPPDPDRLRDAGGRSIKVVGSQCALERGKPGDCADVCRQLMAQREKDRAIEIDATKGSHGTVEALRQCLVDAGATAVEVRSK